jgi:hypothetical protein
VNSRFGYRFKTNVGKPHLLVVHYPDDRRRNMALLDGTCYGAVRSTPVGALARVRSASEIRLLSPSRRGSGQPPG